MSGPKRSSAAVIGVGLAGDNHLRALTALGVPIAGVLSARPERTIAAAERWRTRAYRDLDEVLADPGATVVHICVPPAGHRPLVMAAADGGKDVLCEKPLALDSVEAREMAARAADTNILARVGFNRRFDAGLQHLRSLAGGGELGEPINVWGSYQQAWNAEPSSWDWRFDPSMIGSTRVVGDVGAHLLDLVSHVLGQPLRRLSALLTLPRGEREFRPADAQPHRAVPSNEDGFAALVEYGAGVSGSLYGTQLAHGSWDDIVLRIDGSKRSAWWDSRHPNQATIAHKLEGVRTIGLDSPGRSFEALMAEIYGLAETRIAATFQDGLQNSESIDAVLRSGREAGRWIEVEDVALVGSRA